jgi:hypothetical protein
MPKPINDDDNNILGYIKTTIPTTFYENPIDWEIRLGWCDGL